MLKWIKIKYRELKMSTDVLALADSNISVALLITSEDDDKFQDTMDNLLRERGNIITDDVSDYYYIRGTYRDFNKILKTIRNYLYKHESEETRIDFTIRKNGIIEVFIYDTNDLLKFRENALNDTFGKDR